MKILCGTDFSTAATRAAHAAMDLARRFGDSLVLAHAIAPVSIPPDSGVDLGPLLESLRQASTAGLEEAALALAGRGVAVETVLLEGHPEQQLQLHAQQINARLIVVGSEGRRAPARWVLGSVAERMVDGADRPILVECGGFEGLTAWAAGRRPLELMVGVDLSPASDVALEWVRILRRLGPVNVTLLHLYWPPNEYERLGLEGPRNVLAADPEVVSIIERELRARLGELPGEGTVALRVRPNWGNLGEAVRMDAFYEGADLVLLGTHQRHGLGRLWHGSATHAVLQSAKLPVLCVPLSARRETHPQPLPRLCHVLCATDFSPVGNAAIAYAYALTHGTGSARVELVHVHERPTPNPIYAYAADAEHRLSAAQRTELETKLLALVPKNAAAGGITTRVAVLEGDRAANAIEQAAARLGVDAICLGTHGRSGLAKAALGSVAEAVVRRSARPVFLVPAARE